MQQLNRLSPTKDNEWNKKLKKEFDIQLVVIERNDALDFEEIPSKNLAALQMLYPSAIRENESSEALIFAKAYKKDNKVQPNQYATRGFDVTFDAIWCFLHRI